jgi:phasin family protein
MRDGGESPHESKGLEMQTGQEVFAAVNNSSLAVALATTEAAMVATEKLVRLQMESAKSLLQESLGQTRKLTSLKDFEGVPDMLSAWSKDGLEKLSGYSRNTVAIAQEAQQHMTKALDASTATVQRGILEAVEKAVLQAHIPGSESALAGTKLGLASVTSAMDALNQMIHQMTEFAGASLKAASMGADVSSAPLRKRAS